MTTPIGSESILVSTKAALGVQPTDASFDTEIIMHINSTFGTLTQLGVGTADGFVIVDETAEWADFSPDMTLLASVKSYIYTCVRLLFDPPPTSFGLDSARKTKEELEFRLNVTGEELIPPSDPFPPVIPDDVEV